jgi:hypothetical protein
MATACRTCRNIWPTPIPPKASEKSEVRSQRSKANGLRIEWQGGAQARQFVERNNNLSSSSTNRWVIIYTDNPPTPLQTNLFDFPGTNRTLFYRVRAVREVHEMPEREHFGPHRWSVPVMADRIVGGPTSLSLYGLRSFAAMQSGKMRARQSRNPAWIRACRGPREGVVCTHDYG